MFSRRINRGSTDQSIVIRITDSNGDAVTNIEHDTVGLEIWYYFDRSEKTAITLAALASVEAAHADGGIEHIDDGHYRLDLPDAAVGIFGPGGFAESYITVGGGGTGIRIEGCELHIVPPPFTTALTESYGSAAAPRTHAQILHEMLALLSRFAASGTTLTSYKLNGTTPAKTYTLNDATTPTSLTED